MTRLQPAPKRLLCAGAGVLLLAVFHGRALAQAGPAAPSPLAIKCAATPRGACRPASRIAGWAVPEFVPAPEPTPNETLAEALDAAYRNAPSLQAQRYQLRADDEDYALALAELRPTAALQVAGSYDKTVPGRITQAGRFLASSPIITGNALAAQATLTQPLTTGGKANADREAALAEIGAGRALLRSTEGDLLLAVITAYANVRRDAQTLRLYNANLVQLEETLAEVKARKQAGELTRTDIALAASQLDLVRASTNTVDQQLEQDRAAYAQLVGHDPADLAPPPSLPGLPGSIDEAFALAGEASPDLAQAIAAERQSRAEIASARAAGHPTVSLSGSATLTGNAYPFYLHNDDQEFAGSAVLTVPLIAGGQVNAAVHQAQDRNAADRIGVETARRAMVDNIVNAWNGIATARRNIAVDQEGLAAARLYDKGTFAEYRAGLRSTFDVLYAHSTRLNAEAMLVAAQHDRYVSEATVLRYTGLLEVRQLLVATPLYDPDAHFREAAARSALPWDGAIRAIDRIGAPGPGQKGLQQPPLAIAAPALAPAEPLQDAAIARHSPEVPLPGTVGVPAASQSLARP